MEKTKEKTIGKSHLMVDVAGMIGEPRCMFAFVVFILFSVVVIIIVDDAVTACCGKPSFRDTCLAKFARSWLEWCRLDKYMSTRKCV